MGKIIRLICLIGLISPIVVFAQTDKKAHIYIIIDSRLGTTEDYQKFLQKTRDDYKKDGGRVDVHLYAEKDSSDKPTEVSIGKYKLRLTDNVNALIIDESGKTVFTRVSPKTDASDISNPLKNFKEFNPEENIILFYSYIKQIRKAIFKTDKKFITTQKTGGHDDVNYTWTIFIPSIGKKPIISLSMDSQDVTDVEKKGKKVVVATGKTIVQGKMFSGPSGEVGVQLDANRDGRADNLFLVVTKDGKFKYFIGENNTWKEVDQKRFAQEIEKIKKSKVKK